MKKLLICCAFVGLAATLRAQTPRAAQGDGDAAELASYRLTTATLQKVAVAAHAFGEALQNDPKYKELIAAQRELKALQAKDEPTEAEQQRIEALEQQIETAKKADEGDATDAQTLDDMARTVAKVPHAAEALQAAGLTTREFAKFELVMFQSAFAAGLKKTGHLKELPAGISAENVQFVLDHEAEIQKLQKEMDALNAGKS